MRGINLFRSGPTSALQVINVPQIDFALAPAHRKVNRLAQLLISTKHLERPFDLVAVRPLKISNQPVLLPRRVELLVVLALRFLHFSMGRSQREVYLRYV